ncbi:MAG: hypothetical protein D3924_12960, partial [Candidatus Electrothrix sp. AR4]|nr:hypothetical protein [Candidatus Electrothrix sp. AR4]
MQENLNMGSIFNGGFQTRNFLQPLWAVLSLRQGVGRLIRRSEDRGVMAILDVRLFSKFYGRRFLAS